MSLGYLLILATVPRCRAPHIFVRRKVANIILLLNNIFPASQRVTLVPCPNTTQSATRIWRLPPHLHAALARVETPPRPPVSIQAAPIHLPSTKRCATHLLTPCACLRQEKRATPHLQPSRDRLPPLAPRILRLRHNRHHL